MCNRATPIGGEEEGGNDNGLSRPFLDDILDVPPTSFLDDVPLAVDVETDGPGGRLPVPWADGARLVCVGFACRDGNGGRRFAFPAEDRETIQSWLGRYGQKVFHNAAYDVTWLQSAGLEVKGPIHDTSWILAFENGVAVRGLKPRGAYQYAQHLPKDTALYPRWSAPTAPTTPSTPSRSTIRVPVAPPSALPALSVHGTSASPGQSSRVARLPR